MGSETLAVQERTEPLCRARRIAPNSASSEARAPVPVGGVKDGSPSMRTGPTRIPRLPRMVTKTSSVDRNVPRTLRLTISVEGALSSATFVVGFAAKSLIRARPLR